MIITEYTNEMGQELVSVVYEDGSAWSGLKTVWEAQQEAAKEAQSL